MGHLWLLYQPKHPNMGHFMASNKTRHRSSDFGNAFCLWLRGLKPVVGGLHPARAVGRSLQQPVDAWPELL